MTEAEVYMIMTWVIGLMTAASIVFGCLTGSMGQVSQAAISGAKQATELMFNIGGTICLWNGLMEIMNRSGLSKTISRLLRPVIRLLFGEYARDAECVQYISQNMAANILGLGSAATPAGLKAAKRMFTLSKAKNLRPHGVFMLIVVNTASLQLLPTTVAAVRASLGSPQPFDILPAVWLSSAVSVAVGVGAVCLFRAVSKK